MKSFLVILIISFFFFACSNTVDTNPTRTTSIYKGNYKELMEAVKQEDVKSIKHVFGKYHLNLNYSDSINGISLLNWCIFNKKEKAFVTLLQLGANPNWQDPESKFATTITEAAKVDYTSEFLKSSLYYGGNSNLVSYKIDGISNKTPLLGAIFSKRMENVRMLIEKGADVNLTVDSLWTPLAEALVQWKIEIAKYLLERGAEYKNIRFRTFVVALDKNGNQILGDNGSPIMKPQKELNILDLLRNIEYPLDSDEYKLKIEVVSMLKDKGLDYWNYPIPDKILNNHKGDVNYLSKY